MLKNYDGEDLEVNFRHQSLRRIELSRCVSDAGGDGGVESLAVEVRLKITKR